MEQKRAGWRSPGHSREWISSLRRYAFPRIGEMAVSEVTSADVLEILTPIWHVKAPTARHVHQRIRTVLEWAVAMEFRTDNPCDRIGPILGAQNDVVTHMRALPHRDVASAIETVRGSGAQPVVKLAFEFVVLTAARWGEVRWAEWAQIDRREGVWTIPATRMKAQREHRVPLCRRATEILSAARKLGDGSPLVFTRGGGKPLYEKRLRRLLRNCKIAAVPHGFRSSFRDWAAEETDHPRESHRSGAGACGPEQSRGGLPALGPVRSPTSAHGRLGGVPGRQESRPGGRTGPLICRLCLNTARLISAEIDRRSVPVERRKRARTLAPESNYAWPT